MGPIVVDPALVAEARRAIAQYTEECWATAQRSDPNHVTENFRVYLSMGLIGRAYDVRSEGLHDHRIGWCIGAALQRHRFTVSTLMFNVSALMTLTLDHPAPGGSP